MKIINRNLLGPVDHRIVHAPYVRVDHRNNIFPHLITVDVRVAQPNVGMLPTAVMHSLEHSLAVVLRKNLGDNFQNLGVMGCLTGLYLNVIDYNIDLDAQLLAAFKEVLTLTEVPLCNCIDCGNYKDHTLDGAKAVIQTLLDNQKTLAQVYQESK